MKIQRLSMLAKQGRFFSTKATAAEPKVKAPKKEPTVKLINIKTLTGYDRSDNLQTYTDCEVLIRSGKIVKIDKKISEEADTVHDTKGGLVTPAFVDPHTHIFPPKDRADEYSQRPFKTYEEIAAMGGGILSSVKHCREATLEEIQDKNERNLKRFINNGTLTVEMKSGYGLDLETEIKLLSAIKNLKKKYR